MALVANMSKHRTGRGHGAPGWIGATMKLPRTTGVRPNAPDDPSSAHAALKGPLDAVPTAIVDHRVQALP